MWAKCWRGTCVGVRLPQVLPRPTPRPQLSHGGTMGGRGMLDEGEGGRGSENESSPRHLSHPGKVGFGVTLRATQFFRLTLIFNRGGGPSRGREGQRRRRRRGAEVTMAAIVSLVLGGATTQRCPRVNLCRGGGGGALEAWRRRRWRRCGCLVRREGVWWPARKKSYNQVADERVS